jgi:hypothetical protein
MRKMSITAKLVIGAGTAGALLAYVAIAEAGINAGRIHYGVTVRDVEIGGMTFAEAEEVLREQGEKLRSTPICFRREAFLACARPEDLGWFPGVRQTLDEAMAIGRTGGILGAARERARAWTGGVRIRWAGTPRPHRVTQLIDEWEVELAGLGYTLDRGHLRFKIRQAIMTYPRRTLRVPVVEP